MTRTMFVAALFLSTLVFGCQENNITDPAPDVPTALGKAIVDPSSASGKIDLRGTIGAEKGNDKDLEHKIVGQISYKISTATDGKKKTLRIGLDTEAELVHALEGSSVKIAVGSLEQLTISDKAGEQLDKRYLLETKIGVIALHIRLLVSEKESRLDRMWIERQGFGDRVLAQY